jgi:phosphatidylserine decarboxylase precursor
VSFFFAGDLLSVHPKVAAWFPNLFVVNERAAYYGQWEHGFFVMGIVGATNVGSIKVPFDPVSVTSVVSPRPCSTCTIGGFFVVSYALEKV